MATTSTFSRLAKSKKPLSDFNQLRQAVKQLQTESSSQLHLEVESQATFDFLTQEIKALKAAFSTMSDVFMSELDGLKKDNTKRICELEAHIEQQQTSVLASQQELAQVKRTLELWNLKERDWAKDNEVLKSSHAHHVGWMQQIQRDVMDTRDQVHSLKDDHVAKVSQVMDEAANLRKHWEKQVDLVHTRLASVDSGAEKQMHEIQVQANQRLDDLELMEKALGTFQKQQLHFRTLVDESLHALQSESHQFGARQESLESKVMHSSVQSEQCKSRLGMLEKDSKYRHENLAKIVSVLAEAMHLEHCHPVFDS